MLFISCNKTRCLAKRLALTARATLAKRYRPSGIIPKIAATIEVILS